MLNTARQCNDNAVARTATAKMEGVMLGLVLASGVCGLLLGRYFKIYACFPTIIVLISVAGFFLKKNGLTKGILAFVFSATAMQVCFFISAAVSMFREKLQPKKNRSEDLL